MNIYFIISDGPRAERRLDDLIKSLQKGDVNQTLAASSATATNPGSLSTFKTTTSSAAATVASHLLMNGDAAPAEMIPNNQASASNNSSGAGGRSAPLPLPENYKNNILKAKTFDENKIAEAASSSVMNHTAYSGDRFHR